MLSQSTKWTSRRFALVVAILAAAMCQLGSGSIDQNGYIMILGLIVVPYLGLGTYQNVQARRIDANVPDVSTYSKVTVTERKQGATDGVD